MAKGVKKGSTPSAGQNIPDGAIVLKYVEAVENLRGDLATEKSESMARSKVIHGDIKQVFKDAKKEAGMNRKGLEAVLEERGLKLKLAAVGSNLEGEASDAFAAYSAALEKLAA